MSFTLPQAVRPFLFAVISGLAVGTATLVVAEAIAAVYLIGQQIELARSAQAALSGGIAGLADGRLRELRLAAEVQAALVQQRIALISLLSGTIGAIIALVRFERRSG